MHRPRPFDIVHVSSAHPWTDNRVHLRAAAAASEVGYRTALIAVATDEQPDRDWSVPDPRTGVYVRRLRRRARSRRVLVSTVEAVAAALSSRARIVHLHDPELLWALPFLRLAGRTVVYDAHEDLPAQVLGKEYLGAIARRVVTLLAHALVLLGGRADAVIAATPAIAGRFPAERTTIVRNFPVVGDGVELARLTARPRRAVYLGALSRDRGLGVLTEVAMSDELAPEWSIATAGSIDGAVDRRAFDRATSAGRLEHSGVLAPEAARAMLTECRVGLVPLSPTPAYATSIPTKLFEYMAAGLAIIATDVPFWRELLDGVDCVTWVPPGDPRAVSAALDAYDADDSLLERHGANGQAAVRTRFRWEAERHQLLAAYSTLGLRDPLILAATNDI